MPTREDDTITSLIQQLREYKPLQNLRAHQIPALMNDGGKSVEHLTRLLSVTDHALKGLDLASTSKQREVAELHDLLAISKSLLAPIHKLPRDILIEIFKHVQQPGIFENPLYYRHPTALFHASRVSARWRDVILSTPSLWRDVELRISSIHHTFDLKLDLLRWVFQNSVDFTLHLQIILGGTHENCRYNYIDLFQSISHRIETLSLSGGSIEQAIYLFDPFDGELASLRHLSLRLPYEGLPSVIFVDAPRLISLELVMDRLIAYRFPWAQLQSLCLSTDKAPKLYNVLQQCPGLGSLMLSPSWIVLKPDFGLPPPILFTTLTSLSTGVEWQYAEHDVEVAPSAFVSFQPFTIPCIESLSLDFSGDWSLAPEERYGNFIVKEFEKMITRSNCTLLTLDISIMGWRKLISPLLELVPSLIQLSIHEGNNYHYMTILTEIMPRLNVATMPSESTSSGIFLPHLCKLAISTSCPGVDNLALLAAVQSRWDSQWDLPSPSGSSSSFSDAHGFSRLKRFEYTWEYSSIEEGNEQLPSEAVEGYCEMKQKGFDVSIYIYANTPYRQKFQLV